MKKSSKKSVDRFKKHNVKKKVLDSRKINSVKEKKYNFYFSYSFRLFILLFLFIIFFVGSVFLFKHNLSLEEKTSVSYQESSNVDYKVYLKKNDFYEEPYLGKNRIYVASLIDYININFNYVFSITDKTNLNFIYNVKAKLLIQDDTEENIYFEKEYPLLDGSQLLKESDFYKFDKNIKIDYGYYNDLANKFKTSYGVDTKSSLVVYLDINKSNVNEEMYSFSDRKEVSLTIPLSEKAVNIKMNYENINDSKEFLLSGSGFVFKNGLIFLIGLVFLGLSLFFFFKVLNFISLLKGKKSFYDRYIAKILKEYDRLIVNSKTIISFDEYKVIKVERFEELLDVRDNLKLPIMYYNVSVHQKCHFYIRHEDTIYLLTIKAIDLEENKNEK